MGEADWDSDAAARADLRRAGCQKSDICGGRRRPEDHAGRHHRERRGYAGPYPGHAVGMSFRTRRRPQGHGGLLGGTAFNFLNDRRPISPRYRDSQRKDARGGRGRRSDGADDQPHGVRPGLRPRAHRASGRRDAGEKHPYKPMRPPCCATEMLGTCAEAQRLAGAVSTTPVAWNWLPGGFLLARVPDRTPASPTLPSWQVHRTSVWSAWASSSRVNVHGFVHVSNT